MLATTWANCLSASLEITLHYVGCDSPEGGCFVAKTAKDILGFVEQLLRAHFGAV